MACSLLILLLTYHVSSGVVFSILGQEFLITFQENEIYKAKTQKPQCMTLTTIVDDNIAVQVTSLDPEVNFNTTVIINNATSEYVCLDNSIQLKGTGLSKKVVRVSADQDISVMVHDTEIASADSYIAIPVENYGNDYYIMSYWQESQFSVTATENETVVNIHFRIRDDQSLNYEIDYNGITYVNPSHLVLSMQEHEVYQLNMTHDLTGVFVSSNKPAAVISGNRKIEIYSSGGATDHLAEQMPPVDTWGTHFTSVPSPGKTSTDLYTILASAPCTSVTVGNTTYLLEKEGDMIRLNLSSADAFEIVSDKPILATKYVTRNGDLDQCMMLLVPRRQWLNYYTFRFPEYSNKDGYLILVVESQFRASILLNKEPINIQQWIEVDKTNLSVGYILLPNALYTLYLPETDGYFTAYIQHSQRKFAYCTSIGTKLDKINMAWQDNICVEESTSVTTEISSNGKISESTFVKTSIEITTAIPTDPFTDINSLSTERYSETDRSTTETDKINQTCFNTNPQLLNLSVTDEVFLKIIEELKELLKVVPQKTSQAIRKKISVPDYRPSSTIIGVSWWIVVIVGFSLGILGSDVLRIIKDLRFGVRIGR